VLFIDEAQDLTPLQFALTKIWSADTENTIYAGDSDQAIYRFQGTIPEAFMNMEVDTTRVLTQSYRVSPAVYNYAIRAIQKAKNREPVEYKPTDKYGPGQVLATPTPQLSMEGSHMILCRCRYQANRWIEYLICNGYLWHNPYRPKNLNWNPVKTQAFQASLTYLDLKEGKDVSAGEFKLMASKVRAAGNIKRGFKKTIMEKEFKKNDKIDVFDLAVLGFTDEFLVNSVDDALMLTQRVGDIVKSTRDPLDLRKPPVIIVGTVHSVKGGEADHVWLDLTLTPIIISEMHHDVNTYYDEARLTYVAITRARKTVGVLCTSSKWNPLLPQ
jgi:DNA helicase-2/ATP-dependent DNA helicase PcrA